MRKPAAVFMLLAVSLLLFAFEPACADAPASFIPCGDILAAFGDKDENFHLLSLDKNNYVITHIDSDDNVTEIPTGINADGASYSHHDGTFCFYENGCIAGDVPLFYVEVKIYEKDEDLPHRLVLNNAEYRGVSSCAFDGEYHYIASNLSLRVYSAKGVFTDEYALDTPCIALASSEDGVYCVCAGELVRISGGTVYKMPVVTDSITALDGYFLCNDALFDKYGNIVCGGLDTSRGAAVTGGAFIGAWNGELIAERDGERKRVGECPAGSFIAGSGGVFALFTAADGGAELRRYTVEDIYAQSTDEDSGTGDVIVVDAGVTCAALSRELYEGAVFTRSGAPYSGKLATGVVMTWNGTEHTVIVPGDINGDSGVSTRDLALVEDVLFGKAALDGDAFLAADIMNDGAISLKDARALYLMTKGK